MFYSSWSQCWFFSFMLFYVLSRLIFLIPFLLFNIFGGRPKFVYGFASLYISARITPPMNLNWYLFSLWPSFLYFRNLTMEIISKHALYSRWVKTVFEKFEYSCDVQTSMIILLCLVHVSLVSSKVKQLFKNTTQRSALRQDGYGW